MKSDKCPLCRTEIDIQEKHLCKKIGGCSVYWDEGKIIVEDLTGKRIAEYEPPKREI